MNNRKSLLPFAAAVCLLLLLATCSGCAATSALEEPDRAPAPVAAATSCSDTADLEVPTAINSQQLEELLFAAYLEVKAALAACLTATEPEHE